MREPMEDPIYDDLEPRARPLPDNAEDCVSDLRNAVHQAAVALFEHGEHKRWLFGNGHHMAQRLAEGAVDMWDIWAEHLDG